MSTTDFASDRAFDSLSSLHYASEFIPSSEAGALIDPTKTGAEELLRYLWLMTVGPMRKLLVENINQFKVFGLRNEIRFIK